MWTRIEEGFMVENTKKKEEKKNAKRAMHLVACISTVFKLLHIL